MASLDRSAAERLFQGFLQLLHRPPSETEKLLFDRYLTIMVRWNRISRLTAYKSRDEIVQKLFLDSLLFLEVLPKDHSPLLDLGSGAGIPGIPLKIVEPSLALTLLESQRRRTSFLAAAVRELALENVQVVHGRGEKLIKENPKVSESFQAVTARAAGPLEAVISLACQLLKPGGTMVISGAPASGSPPPRLPDPKGQWKSRPRIPHRGARQFFVMQKPG